MDRVLILDLLDLSTSLIDTQSNIDREAGEGGEQAGQGDEDDEDNESQEDDKGNKEDTVKYIVVDN